VLLVGAVLLAVLLAGESSRAMLASARLSCTDCDVSVSEYSGHVHENIQPHLHHAADRSLERLHAVLHSDAARLSLQHVGRHQRTTGETIKYSI